MPNASRLENGRLDIGLSNRLMNNCEFWKLFENNAWPSSCVELNKNIKGEVIEIQALGSS